MPGKVCVVVGVGPGLGMSCVRRWTSEGYQVPDTKYMTFIIKASSVITAMAGKH